MKGMTLFCSSTAITNPLALRSTKKHASVRRKSQLRVPCSSKLPINPYSYKGKHRKSSENNQNSDNHGSPSTSYLLSDVPFIDWVSKSDIIPTMAPANKPAKDQVVVLRVSLHCKACEGKVRKHISKMEGVTSFSIDMEAKKVTVIGHVTPLGVLASVSKVKNAQLWPSSTSFSSLITSQKGQHELNKINM